MTSRAQVLSGQRTLTHCSRLFRGTDGIEEAEEMLDPRDLEGVVDALAYSDQRQIASAILTSNVSCHQSAYAGRIHIRHVGKIDDQRTGSIGPHRPD